ncbi:phospholipase D-like domain-containing protein [Mesomycoplasma lagogenitalium]|uniref:Phospholipase D-like domain-containing protein n=1 Tax=Mesomycoplasma lagogenitalium TaxID=171286 RepID=A0ABY8LSV6_9BACT|nr:phospholipase D-like domain-containing protein [Mesomycoplasma lagogenitalium]WGI36340.1 phospholipase D-like domain-containing protein [Mesomycoplasma lagogenitalium]
MSEKNWIINFLNFLFLSFWILLLSIFIFLLVKYSNAGHSDKSILIIIFSFYLFNLIFIVFILLQERNIDAKFSWVFIIIFMPFLGQILFLIFGRKYKTRISEKKYLKLAKVYSNKNTIKKNNKFSHLEPYFQKISSTFKTEANFFKQETIFNGYEFYKKLLNDLKNAKKVIYIEVFIIKDDFIWNKIKNILIDKAKNGVEIKLILDWWGTIKIKSKDWKLLKKANIKFIRYNKIIFPFISSSSFYRIHKKIFIIDSSISYIGGNNISDEYANFSSKYGFWFDTNLRMEGKITQDLMFSFINDWNRWHKDKIENIENYFYKQEINEEDNYGIVFEGGPQIDVSLLESALIQMIYNAKEKIKIFTPYFVPTTRIFLALKESLISGKKIEIYIPEKYDKNYVKPFTLYFAKQLEEYGAKIYKYKNSFSHSKTIIFDDQIAYTGTMNLDIRSLYSQFEINILLSGEFVDSFLKNIEYRKEKRIILSTSLLSNKKINFFKKIFIEIFKPLL